MPWLRKRNARKMGRAEVRHPLRSPAYDPERVQIAGGIRLLRPGNEPPLSAAFGTIWHAGFKV